MQIAVDSPKEGLDEEQLREAALVSLMGLQPKSLLLIADTDPDSGAGRLVQQYYWMLRAILTVKILPASGGRVLSRAERAALYGDDLPEDAYLVPGEYELLGTLSSDQTAALTNGQISDAVPVTLDKAIADCEFDLVFVLGRVAPDALGVTGYTRQLTELCGGPAFGDALKALPPTADWDKGPARALCDAAEEQFLLNRYPIVYVMTVTTRRQDELQINGIYVGRKRSLFEQAARLAVQLQGE